MAKPVTSLFRYSKFNKTRASRFVANLEYNTRTSVVLKQVGWLSVKQLYVYHSLVLVWKIIQSGEPLYLKEKFKRNFSYATRQATSNCLSLSQTPRSVLSKKSFVHNSTTLWNSLPSELRNNRKLLSFKAKLKVWVIENHPL